VSFDRAGTPVNTLAQEVLIELTDLSADPPRADPIGEAQRLMPAPTSRSSVLRREGRGG
jgi:hypothetical protein